MANATNNDIAEALQKQSEDIGELTSSLNSLVQLAQMQMTLVSGGDETPATATSSKEEKAAADTFVSKIEGVAKNAAKDAIKEARKDLPFYDKPLFKIAAGATGVAIGAYFIHKAVKQSGAANAAAGRNTATIGLLGLEPDGEGGIVATGLTGIGKK